MLDEYYDFRGKLAEQVELDLIGPSSTTEIVNDPPITRYVSGVLYPRYSGKVDSERDIDQANDEKSDDSSADPPVALSNVRYPSSMGLTFAVDLNAADSICIRVSAGRYAEILPDEVSDESASTVGKWKRRPVNVEPIRIDVTSPTTLKQNVKAMEPTTEEDVTGLLLFARVRPADSQGIVPVTIVLMNNRRAPNGILRDAESYFQTRVTVETSETGDRAPFVERRSSRSTIADKDIRSYRLLYRNACEFAVGHGCSVTWTIDSADSKRAIRIATTFAPFFELPLAESNPNITSEALSMQFVIRQPKPTVLAELRRLCDGYETWIRLRADEIALLEDDLVQTASEHLSDCRQAMSRMRIGVDLLDIDESAWVAFVLANEAMLQQRSRTVWLRAGKPSPEPEPNETHKWRPFQMAFILLCLPGLADPRSPDRNLADLLWFPTGGGKTEAYLGLIAFTVFLRRLRYRNGGGVTALMRYTLRLLTLQQFERASLLICCLEAIRRSHPELGRAPISIGLWVGGDATPNNLDKARESLNKLRAGTPLTKGDPCQLRNCPWCGNELDYRNYYIAQDKSKMIVACRQASCLYEKSLPVYLVDDDVYRHRPTLIIATVDKFASLPWREQTAELFNLNTPLNPQQPPLELIIQDELHLISGPLGTLVGLYETAIDGLATHNGVRPKVIASTATIRRADQQTAALFNREVRQFPPPGIAASDSYFAVEAPRSERGTRMYVGLMAPGTSHTTLLVRTYAALLQYAAQLSAPDPVKDPYWTLVGYFNSLRVLGGARMQVQDDVNDRIRLLAQNAGAQARPIEEFIELTSREPSGNIPTHLKRMATTLGGIEPAVDVILATNMISVGVDVDRLGLMAVMGQPQSTSEYIQATSRVGRRYPGLVYVLFNAARSRDRSHYESFVAYHSALYRQVESASVTPFSARSRDRGLHAVLVALTRLLVADLRGNHDAREIERYAASLESIKQMIIDRVRDTEPDQVGAATRQLEALITKWRNKAQDISDLDYNNRDSTRTLLIGADYEGANREEAFPTLWSLRDVDRESNLYLIQQ